MSRATLWAALLTFIPSVRLLPNPPPRDARSPTSRHRRASRKLPPSQEAAAVLPGIAFRQRAPAASRLAQSIPPPSIDLLQRLVSPSNIPPALQRRVIGRVPKAGLRIVLRPGVV